MNYDAITQLLGQHYAPEEKPAYLSVIDLLGNQGGASPAQPPGVPSVPAGGGMKQYARRLAREMFGRGHWDELNQLVSHESSWNPQADNPTSTAYGLFQFLDSTRENYGLADNAGWQDQVEAGLQYVKDRYGDPSAAWDFWTQNHYY